MYNSVSVLVTLFIIYNYTFLGTRFVCQIPHSTHPTGIFQRYCIHFVKMKKQGLRSKFRQFWSKFFFFHSIEYRGILWYSILNTVEKFWIKIDENCGVNLILRKWKQYCWNSGWMGTVWGMLFQCHYQTHEPWTEFPLTSRKKWATQDRFDFE